MKAQQHQGDIWLNSAELFSVFPVALLVSHGDAVPADTATLKPVPE